MRQVIPILVMSLLLAVSCNKIKQKAKDTINKGGETVGKSATEFVEGVSEGIDKTLQCEINLSKELKENGVRTGKFLIENSDTGGENNRLVLYLIFDKDFDYLITAKAFDKNNSEVGRTSLEIVGKKGEAKYYEFEFGKRTYIESKSKIIIE